MEEFIFILVAVPAILIVGFYGGCLAMAIAEEIEKKLK
jgi:hypothetical protein